MSKATLAKLAKSKTEARKIAAQISTSQLDSAINNLVAARAFLAKQATKRATIDRRKKIKKAMTFLDRMGLTPDDLERLAPSTRKKTAKKSEKPPAAKRKVAPKYRIKVNGKVTLWTGRGRMPVVFREAINKNGDLGKYLIK